MELNAKLNREKEENKNINKKNNKESDAKNKILILGILILIVSGLFLSIGLNANNMDYALSQRIPKLLSIILTGVCISISTTIFQTITGNKILTPNVMGLDSLYVLIHNAAIHGKPNGQIHFDVSPCADRNALKIRLNTEVSSIYELMKAKERILSFLHENDDDAHVVEGNSGIKKLKKLEREGSISNIHFSTNNSDLTLCFEYLFELNSRGDYDLDS